MGSFASYLLVLDALGIIRREERAPHSVGCSKETDKSIRLASRRRP
jgi:hypothetical protein